MKKLPLLLVVAALLISTAAMADTTVTYSTTGTFSGTGAAGNVLHLGGDTITFIGEAPGTTATLISTGAPLYDFGYPQLGMFKESGGVTGSTNGTQSFTLQLFQTTPGVGTATQVGVLKGTLKKTGTTLSVTFGAPTFTFPDDNIVYSTLAGSPIDNINWGVRHSTSISSGGKTTTLEGVAQTIPAPEPSSLLLLGAGLSGLVGTIRRKRQ